MYPGQICVKNGDAWSDLVRRRSTGSFGHLVGRNSSGGTRGSIQERSHVPTDHERADGPRLQCNAKQCHEKLKALKKRYEEVIDKQRQSGAGVESKEEGTEVDFCFFAQIHRVLGSRAVVNPPQLLKNGTPQSHASSESSAPVVQPFRSRVQSSSRPSTPETATPLAQAARSRLLSSSSRQSTPKVLTLPPPVTEEVEEEDTHEPSADQSATELPVAEPEQSAPVTVPEQSVPVAVPEQSAPVAVPEQSAPATEPATQQSLPGPSHAKK